MNVLDEAHGRDWTLYHGDCVHVVSQLPDNSIDFSVYSPPFANIYTYSESIADMGNVRDDDEFFERYRFLIREKLRVTRPGRLTAIHVKDIPYYQSSSKNGDSGLRDFTGGCVRAHMEEGWSLHCKVTIFRDPVLERAKTNAHGLLWKTFKADASFCRVGMPEYVLVFRKWAKPGEEGLVRPVTHPADIFPLDMWQSLASPVWNCKSEDQSGRGDMDMAATDTLNVELARDPDANKHLCPMPLNITRRALDLWSNPGDVVLSPFAGVGSEGVASIGRKRRFVGVELSPEYYGRAIKFLESAKPDIEDLFAVAAA